MESVIKNALRVTIVSKEIERADRIVYETGIYKAVVVSTRAGECFFYILKLNYWPDWLWNCNLGNVRFLWFGCWYWGFCPSNMTNFWGSPVLFMHGRLFIHNFSIRFQCANWIALIRKNNLLVNEILWWLCWQHLLVL